MSNEFEDRYSVEGVARINRQAKLPDAVILDRARVLAGGNAKWFVASAEERRDYIAQAEAQRAKMTKSAEYGKTDSEVNHATVVRVTPPDYADIQRLENLVWKSGTTATDFHVYAHEYHQLAVKFSEDVVILCIEQYNRGARW